MKNILLSLILLGAALFSNAQETAASEKIEPAQQTSKTERVVVPAPPVPEKANPDQLKKNQAFNFDSLFSQTREGSGDWKMVPVTLSYAMTIVAILVLLSACASKLSSWINMPCLLVFLAVGIFCGPNGFGYVKFDDPAMANMIGSLAMAFILFSGGFETNWKTIKSVLRPGGFLSSLGVLITAFSVGFFSFYLFSLAFPNMNIRFSSALLLGAIVSSTDAAAVFSILRSRRVSLHGNLRALLELESGSNDPMAAFLTVFMVGVVLTEASTGTAAGPEIYKAIIPAFAKSMLLGIALGVCWGYIMVWLFNRIDLEYDGLYYVLGVGIVLLSYGATEMLGGNGFMSVYVTGVFMGNKKFIYHNGVGRFSEGMAWLMQVVLFTMLGLLLSPLILLHIWWIGLVIAFLLMVVARPIAVFLCMMGKEFNLREKLLVSWVGLRGGAPIMLATYPLMAGLPQNNILFHTVFFIVLTSVLLQGMTIMPVAKMLKLDTPLQIRPRVPLEFDNTGTMNGETREFEILPESPLIGKPLSAAGLPKGALVLLIRREKEYVVPHGDTLIQKNDGLLVLGEESILDATAVQLKDPQSTTSERVS